MKKFIIFFVLFYQLSFCSLISADISALTYVIEDNYVKITKCDSSASGTLEIPETIDDKPVKVIGTNSFYLSSLKEVLIPDSVEVMESYIFIGTQNLEKVTIGSGIKSIGEDAFNLSTLSSLTLQSKIPPILESGEMYGGGRFEYLPQPREGLSIIVPEESGYGKRFGGFKVIGAQQNSDLGYLDYNDMGNYMVIDYCDPEATGEINIPFSINGKPVKKIGKNAFFLCSKITSVVLPNGIESIENDAFNQCTSLETVIIPESVTMIREGAFRGCVALKNIQIPKNIQKIEAHTFIGCNGLEDLDDIIHSGIISIGVGAFSSCNGFEILKIPDTITEIGMYAFENCSATRIELPKNLELIDTNAFTHCTKLTSIVIPESVKEIRKNAFHDCWKLKSIKFEGDVNVIGRKAFALGEANILNRITFLSKKPPEDVAYNAFGGDRSEVDLFVPMGAVEFGVEWQGFMVKQAQPPEKLGDLEYQIYQNEVIIADCDPAAEGTISIPETIEGKKVTKLSSELFIYCSKINSLEIPSSINTIPEYAFMGCTSLESISLPDSITNIGLGAFQDCTNLETVKLPPNINDLGLGGGLGGLFRNCSNLRSIVIPNGIKEIPPSTFIGCKNLVNIELPESIESIKGLAFAECESLRTITFPKSLETIGYNAFKYCNNLQELIFLNNDPPRVKKLWLNNFGDPLNASIIVPEGATAYGNTFIGLPVIYRTMNPTPPAEDSLPEITSISFNSSSNSLTLVFNSAEQTEYYLEKSLDMRKWETITTIEGDSDTTQYEDFIEGLAPSKLFYRVKKANTDQMAEEKLVAFYDFEKSNNLISTESFETTSGNVLEPNSFSSLGDGWGIYNRNTGGPFAIFDDSVQGSGNTNPYPRDSQGFVDSKKTDSFWGITDTKNRDLSDGLATVDFKFDISSAKKISRVSMEFAGMGNFSNDDYVNVSFRVDDNDFHRIFYTTFDNNQEQTYQMEDGDEFTHSKAIKLHSNFLSGLGDTKIMNNRFETISTKISCPSLDDDIVCVGNEITIRVEVSSDGNNQSMGFDTINIYGVSD